MARETDDSSSSPPNKRLKTLNPQIESQSDSNQPETPPDRCAICFLDDGKAARGKIDCCDHYFCFMCIKEWAKTESRCPICRRRFNSIRRPPKFGVFDRERVVKVPVRDQGDKRGHVDAYEEVACNVCNSMSDDHFMLLCDLCDGAAHTYCVGLGYTVPEGDWFCNDCIASRPELANVNSADDECGMIPTEAVPVPCVSVCDIVREPNSSRAIRISSNSSQPTVVPQVARPVKAPPRVASISAESAARTLDRCRNVQTRIHTLRENWTGFRSGVLSFPASSSKSKVGCSSSQEHNNGVMSHERSAQAESSSSPSFQQRESRDGCDPYDIDKAWKMLERAKSKQCIHRKSGSGVQLLQFSKLPSSRTSTSKEPTKANPCPDRSGQPQSSTFTGRQLQQNQVGCGLRDINKAWQMMDREILKQHVHENTSSAWKANASEEAGNVNSSFDTLKSQQLGALNQGGPGRSGIEKVYKGKKMQSRVTTQEAVESILGISCSNSSPGLFMPPFPRNINGSASSIQKSQAALNVVNEQNGSASTMEETSYCGKPELSTSFSMNLEEACVESRARKVDDEAKSEIQSLVKMNVKLLSKDQRLGVDAFKQIARAATHTVLAACGLEHHHKSAVYSVPSLVCRHAEKLQLPHQSNLMREACRDCFYGFVKDVVTSILHNHDGFRLRRASHKQK